MIKGVIFDFDGTICLTEESRFYAIKKVLEQENIVFTNEMWNSKYKRMNSLAIFEELGLEKVKRELYELSFIFRRAYLKEKGAQLATGFLEFYENLKNNNINVIIASGGQRDHVAYVMERMNLPEIPFLGRSDYELPKPSNDVFQKALEKMNLLAKEVVIFDDSISGLKAGISLGAKVIAINADEEKGIENISYFMKIKDFTGVSLDKLN